MSGQCCDISALFKYSECLIKPPSLSAIMEDKDIYKALVEEYKQRPIQLFLKKLSCAACIAVDVECAGKASNIAEYQVYY